MTIETKNNPLYIVRKNVSAPGKKAVYRNFGAVWPMDREKGDGLTVKLDDDDVLFLFPYESLEGENT